MRHVLFVSILALIAAETSGQQTPSQLWSELKAKRQALPGLHEEFEVSQTFTTAGDSRSSHRRVIVDLSKNKWRERTISGSDDRVRIFDGKQLFVIEAEAHEYIRAKNESKEAPEASPYGSFVLDWGKAKEVSRRPCGFQKNDHTCVVMAAPLKAQSQITGGDRVTRLVQGAAVLELDLESGALVIAESNEGIERTSNAGPSYPRTYGTKVTYALKQMSYGVTLDESLFNLPETGMREVKEFTKWNASRIRKQLAGKAAPDLDVMDISGHPISLSGLRGKTVLLDFWTTWCPPCLADAPVLDKLYSKYESKNLAIIGISVSEERQIVEKFLQKHPHKFPVLLTSENDMPHAYQIGLFPTYIVIAPDGTVSGAFEGDQGFSDLRKHLAKAGMETN